ncbi:MAG: LacI family DNA-binding transcriptional regulator [Lachnospiraceae bacterium]|nr:LacI family DNA-binding transcriptional regulator [Lachnospiraceae bacterium]
MQEKYRKITRKDVAREAGVTETIVSYVINNNRYVDKEKRKRVEEAIKKLHYRPNTIARALKGKKLNNIVFIADQIDTEHFSILMSELDKYAYDLGYVISLCANRNTQEFVDGIISRQYDGVIISSISFPKEFIQQFIRAGIPVMLLVNRDYDDIEGAGKINTGLYPGMRESVRYLVSLGRRNIIYIDRYSQRGHFSNREDMRYRGFVEEMKECGISQNPEKCVITGCRDAGQVKERVIEYLRCHGVDAICGRNDRMACIAMQAVQSQGYTIPKDIAVVGFDNATVGQFSVPPLTTMEIQRRRIAETTIRMLRLMIEEGKVPEEVAYPTNLIIRESTRGF